MSPAFDSFLVALFHIHIYTYIQTFPSTGVVIYSDIPCSSRALLGTLKQPIIAPSVYTLQHAPTFSIGRRRPTLKALECALTHDAAIKGLGWFETVSTRAAGLQIMDFHYVNHGMLVVWAIMMYVSSAPLVSRMYVSEQTEQVTHFRIYVWEQGLGPCQVFPVTNPEDI